MPPGPIGAPLVEHVTSLGDTGVGEEGAWAQIFLCHPLALWLQISHIFFPLWALVFPPVKCKVRQEFSFQVICLWPFWASDFITQSGQVILLVTNSSTRKSRLSRRAIQNTIVSTQGSLGQIKFHNFPERLSIGKCHSDLWRRARGRRQGRSDSSNKSPSILENQP